MPRRSFTLPVLIAAALATFSTSASAQGRRLPAPADGWAPIEVGLHGGYDYSFRGSVVGAQLRIPLLPSGYLELVPSGDVTFLTGVKEYTGGATLVAVSGGRRGGLYAGGGLVWRNTLYDGSRSTRRAPALVVGVRTPALLGTPFGTQLEVRWIRADTDVKPKILTFGVNFPLWGWNQWRRR